MRCAVFSLLLSAGYVAFGQADPAFPLSPGEPFQTVPSWSLQKPDFGKALRNWDALRVLPQTVIEIAPPKPGVLLGDARIDPHMVVRPSRSRVGALPEGKLVAQNLYPGLRFQPIDKGRCKPNSGLLSTTWPRLKVEEIPTQWPGMEMVPIGGDLPASGFRSSGSQGLQESAPRVP